MSYLQRLATQTIKAPGNVRPLVNPYVNSTESRPESADEGFAEETIYRNQPKPLPRRTGIPSSLPAFADGQTSQKVSSAEVSRGLRESSTESIPFEPLTGESEIEGKTSAKDRVVHLEHPLLENSRPQAQAHAESASPGDVPIEIVMQESIEPETRKDPARPRQPPVGKAAHQVRPSDVRILDPHPTRGMEQTYLPRNSGPRLRGADEIEINIGRIEVTAIPPAAPRSTPPARKSLNLDEYLQRRNGRNDR